MMRFVAIFPYFYPRIGGGETHLRLLGTCLARRHGMEVVALTQRLPGTPAHEVIDGIRIHRLGDALSRSGQTRAYRGFAQYVSECAEEAVFYISFSVGSVFRMRNIGDLMEVCIRSAKRFIVRIPSSGRVSEAVAHDRRFQSLLCEADAVVALNSDIRAELASIGVQETRTAQITNAVDSGVFYPDPAARAHVRRRLGLARTTVLALSVSRFAPKKRIPELVQTWGDVRAMGSLPPRSLLIIGDDRHEHVRRGDGALLTGPNGAANAMHYLGHQPHQNLPRYYAAADVFLSYSTQEGMSNALLEAMASGLVAVAPSTSATLSICAEPSNFLYQPDDSGMRLRQLVRSLSCPERERRAMGEANARKARTEFRPESMADEFHALIGRVAGSQRL